MLYNVLSSPRVSAHIQIQCYLVPISHLKTAIDNASQIRGSQFFGGEDGRMTRLQSKTDAKVPEKPTTGDIYDNDATPAFKPKILSNNQQLMVDTILSSLRIE